jgi:hypothetical protein
VSRVRRPTVTDGPCTQAQEVIGGSWMIQANSKQAAVARARRCPALDGDGIEVSEVLEMADFPVDVQTAADNPMVRAQIERVKARDAASQENMMKYICLGYYDEQTWETMSERERNALMDECFAYDDVLRKNGHFVGGEALQSARNATTLRWKDGKVLITDGPYAETKELLGGILVLEARDLNHAIQLMSKHPGVKAGPFEIRPAEDLTAMIRDSERRRSKTKDE